MEIGGVEFVVSIEEESESQEGQQVVFLETDRQRMRSVSPAAGCAGGVTNSAHWRELESGPGGCCSLALGQTRRGRPFLHVG